MAAGKPCEYEIRLRRADGEYHWFLVRTVPLRDEQGHIVKWYGTSTDIEDRRRAEDALRDSEERFAAFMDNLPGYAWMKDLQGRYVYINQMVRGLPGYGSLGKTDAQIWPADLAAEYRANDQQVIAAKKPLHTVEHYLQEGKQRYMVGSKFPIFDKNGAVALVGGAGVDITERIEAEEALRHSEERLRSALEEREHLSRDLHDNIVQSIYAIGMRLEQCLGQSPDNIDAQLAQVIEELNGLIRDMRQYIKGPEQTVISGPELRAELLKQVKAIATAEGPLFEVELDSDAIAQLSPDEAEQVLYIALEALSNSMRHSNARRGTLALCLADGDVRLEIRDDGLGFDSRQPKQAGDGLRNMKLRAEEIAGKLEVLSSPGSGTRVILDIRTKIAMSIPLGSSD